MLTTASWNVSLRPHWAEQGIGVLGDNLRQANAIRTKSRGRLAPRYTSAPSYGSVTSSKQCTRPFSPSPAINAKGLETRLGTCLQLVPCFRGHAIRKRGELARLTPYGTQQPRTHTRTNTNTHTHTHTYTHTCTHTHTLLLTSPLCTRQDWLAVTGR